MFSKKGVIIIKNIIEINKDKAFKIKNYFNDYPFLSGTFANVYLDGDTCYKLYKKEPYLKDKNCNILFNSTDVFNNILYFSNNKFNGISNIEKVYLLENKIFMYEMENLSYMMNISDIGINFNKKNYLYEDVLLKDFFLSWDKAYELAEKLSNNNIEMNDVKEENAFIYNGDFKVCDIDFYKKGNIDSKWKNYFEINNLFINFLERYFFSNNYEDNVSDEILKTKKYKSYVIKKLSSYNAKSLKEVSLNMK